MEFSSGTMAGIRKRWKRDLGQEVKGQEEEDAQTTTCTCMDGMR